ncbi:hypothetical protein GPECTOR_70g488 [Gonium pectorale]|uniref:protein-L-isoaspartate(D-aspartate) O-methyltransferase n=1 Tax=Gonium pectorale TaxID=33097 RepID=A0A150G329_GONPE|nr:hypothetical protein GPECTOR_70g488 [Gonium pectorale]|eukprot:KXZ44257.1 hypothetical protein GPECTOR_70g488 [Gonium pectorale]
MHATALELLIQQLRPGARVLDVGSGSGYLTACFGLLVSPGGRVLGVEVVPQLAAGSEEALWQVVPQLMQDGTVQIRAGNVLTGMLASEAAFDAIHVGAAAEELPRDLVAKLAPGGRMVIPVGPHGGYQVLTVVDKQRTASPREAWQELAQAPYGPGTEAPEEGARSGGIRVTKLMDVGYVPLVGGTSGQSQAD